MRYNRGSSDYPGIRMELDERTESETQDVPPDIQSELAAESLTIAVSLQSISTNVVSETRTNSITVDC